MPYAQATPYGGTQTHIIDDRVDRVCAQQMYCRQMGLTEEQSAVNRYCSSSSFFRQLPGGYFADNINYGTWNVTVDNNGAITGKITSAPGLPPSEFYVIGNVNSRGSISFTASVSPTIQWRFEGTLSNTIANGIWIEDSLPGNNPPNKVWNGSKQQ